MGDGYVRIANTVARDARLSMQARTLYVVLRSYAHGDRAYCWPGRRRLAEDCGCSVDTVKRLIHEIVDAGLVSVEQRPGRSSVYWFGPSGRGTHAPTPDDSRTDHPVHPCTAEEDKVKKTKNGRRARTSTTTPPRADEYQGATRLENW